MRAQHRRARFADLHVDVGAARVGQGDFPGAAKAYRSAHACRPRDAQILAALAGVLFDARDYAGAREAINASLAIEPRAVNANRLAGNIDFVAERWADAVSRFRYVAASDPDRVQAGYGQLMFWLSQMRAGVAKPEYVRTHARRRLAAAAAAVPARRIHRRGAHGSHPGR